MRRLIKTVLIAILGLSLPFGAYAQRTAVGRYFISIGQQGTFYGLTEGLPSGGASIEFGQYLLNSYWFAGISAADMNQKANTDPSYFYDNLICSAYGGWKYRVIKSYSRGFNVYLGGSAFIGLNSYEVFRKLKEEHSGNFSQNEFIYGIQPDLECEIYMGSRVALLLQTRLQVAFSESFSSGLFLPIASLGIRINL